MDDTILYAKSEQGIDLLIQLKQSEDIGISFEFEKYGGIVVKRVKVFMIDRVNLLAGYIIDIKTSYKYISISQSLGNYDEETRKTSKYYQRIR